MLLALLFSSLLISQYLSRSPACPNGTTLKEGKNNIYCTNTYTESEYWVSTRIGVQPGLSCNIGINFVASIDEPNCAVRLSYDGSQIYEVLTNKNKGTPVVFYKTGLTSADYIEIFPYKAGNCYSSNTLTITGSCISPNFLSHTNVIPSGLYAENFTVSPAGGYTYFSLPLYSYTGGVDNVTWSAVVTSYRGLKPPLFIISDGAFPTLESHDFTNTTVKNGDNYIFTCTMKIVPNAITPLTYVLGMYLYGTASRFFIGPKMLYSAPNLPVDDTTSIVLTQGSPVTYNISIPSTYRGKSITFQFAREVPGGNTTIYFGYGYIASAGHHDLVADTAKSGSFGTLSIPNTLFKLRSEWEANPGTIMVSLVPSTPKAGILIQWQLE